MWTPKHPLGQTVPWIPLYRQQKSTSSLTVELNNPMEVGVAINVKCELKRK